MTDAPSDRASAASNAYSIASEGITFDQYFEVKHHGGNNVTDWYAVDPSTGNRMIDDLAGKEAEISYKPGA